MQDAADYFDYPAITMDDYTPDRYFYTPLADKFYASLDWLYGLGPNPLVFIVLCIVFGVFARVFIKPLEHPEKTPHALLATLIFPCLLIIATTMSVHHHREVQMKLLDVQNQKVVVAVEDDYPVEVISVGTVKVVTDDDDHVLTREMKLETKGAVLDCLQVVKDSATYTIYCNENTSMTPLSALVSRLGN